MAAQALAIEDRHVEARDGGRPLRILHCMRAPVGGLFRHVLDLAREQAARGHAVGILADDTTGDRLTEMRLDSLRPVLSLGISRTAMSRHPSPRDLRAVRFTADLATRLGVDVLHGHGAKGGAYARLAARAIKRQGHCAAAFYTPHGGSLNYAPGTVEARVFLGLEKLLVSFTDGVVFESAHAARIFDQRVCPIDGRSRVVPNGLQPADFVEHAPAPDAAEFLFVGELRDIKGVDVMLVALAELNRSRPARAVIVGSGPDAASLQALAHDLGLGGVVRFPGAMPARDAFALGRTIVVPSRTESFPYIVLEAGAAGLPLLTTGVGGIPEMLSGTDTPMLPAGDASALAQHMRFALDNAAEMQARAARFKAVVASRYTVAGMTGDIVAFYRERLC